MRRTSLAEAKSHLSALVDDAEHHRRRTIILRHGKPAAAIVPLEVAVAAERARAAGRPRLSADESEAVFADLGTVSPEASAVEDLLAGRR